MTIGIIGALTLTVSLGSHHLSEDHKPSNMDSYNENNFGLSIEYEIKNGFDFEAGFYKNSINRTSLHTGLIAKTHLEGNWNAGVNFGIVTGYNTGPFILPFVHPYIQYRSIRIGYIPDSNVSEAVITFGYSYTFGK